MATRPTPTPKPTPAPKPPKPSAPPANPKPQPRTSYTSIAADVELSVPTDAVFLTPVPPEYADMKFNRLVLRGDLRVKKIPAPGGGVFLAGPYTQSLPTIGPVDGAAPSTTDTDGYNTLTALIAGEATSTVTIPGDIIYEVNAAVQLPDGKTLRAADGTSVTIKRAAGYSGNMIEASGLTSPTLTNITFDGNFANNPAAAQNSAACGVYVFGGSGVTISHCRFYDMPSYGIYSEGSTNITVQYNEFDECFSACHIDGTDLADSGSVTGNTFTNTSARRSYNALVLTQTKNAQVFHNTFEGVGSSQPLLHGGEGSYGNSIYINESSLFNVENNTCNQSYWSSFQANINSTNGTVNNNYFCAGTATTVGAWITNTGTNNILFTLNLCDGTVSVGSGGGNNCIVTNNIVNAYANGIEANEGAINITIQGNTITRLSGSGDGILLWNKTDPATLCQVLSNTITGFTSGGIGINNTGNSGLVFGITANGNTFTSNTLDYSIPIGITLHASCVLEGYQVPAATPAPTPAPPPATTHVMMSYYPAYDNTYPITDLPNRYTHVVLFSMAPQGNTTNGGKGTASAGTFVFNDDWNVTQSQIQTIRARGQKVIVSIGGAGRGYYFENATEVSNFVASFQAFNATHGPFDGIDYNCYEADVMPSNASNAYVDVFAARINQISTQLRALYGSTFIISTPPNPTSGPDQRLCEAMDDAGLITFACPQYYDWTGFAATNFIRDRNRTWVDTVFDGDESKVVLGLPSNYVGGGGPTLTQSLAEWDKCVAEYPNMRGVYGWNLILTLGNGDTFGQQFANKLF